MRRGAIESEESMEIRIHYKVISGALAEVEQVLNVLSQDGWRPITMSRRSSVLTVILENKVMEEAKLNLSSALGESTSRESAMEEVQ
jgi:hypothetical protein